MEKFSFLMKKGFVLKQYQINIEQLKEKAISLFCKRKAYMNDILLISDKLKLIENLPSWYNEEIQRSLEMLEDFKKVVEYEKSPKEFVEDTDIFDRNITYLDDVKEDNLVAIMPIATVIGTATTGTVKTALSGVAATNAALAWLGGSIANASLALTLFGPIGWAILGLSAMGFLSSHIKNKNDIKKAEEQIDKIEHDYIVIQTIHHRISSLMERSEKNKQKRLKVALKWIETIQPRDYNKWNEEQKHELDRLINTVYDTVLLINERV